MILYLAYPLVFGEKAGKLEKTVSQVRFGDM